MGTGFSGGGPPGGGGGGDFPYGGVYPGGGYASLLQSLPFSSPYHGGGYTIPRSPVPFGIPVCQGSGAGGSGSGGNAVTGKRVINMNDYPLPIVAPSGKKYLLSPREVTIFEDGDVPSTLPRGVFVLPDS